MSETTNLKLKKHDNPSTNEEQFDVENYLNGNWDKIEDFATNVNSKITEIEGNVEDIQNKDTDQDNKIQQLETEKANLETELKEMQEDFYQASIRGKASGEYIHVEDSSNARSTIGIGGNHVQETRSGKNKFNIIDYNDWTVYENSKATVTKSSDKITIVTGSNSLSGLYTLANIFKTYIDNYDSSKTYYLSADIKTNAKVMVKFGFENETVFNETINGTKRVVSTGKGTGPFILYGSTEGVTIEMSNVMICEVNDTTYEQHGVMPSPDYPSEIKTVGDNVNIFDKEKYRNISNWSNSQNFFIYCKLDEEDTKKFKRIITGNMYLKKISQNLVFGISTTNDGSSFNNQYRILDNGSIKNITYDFSNAKDIYLCVGNSNKISVDKNEINLIFDNYDIKLEKGTVATSYSSYGQGSVKVTKCNKNILNIEDIDETEKGGIKYSIKNDVLKLNGTSTTTVSINLLKNIKIKKGKYTHSASHIQSGLYISLDNISNTMISSKNGKKMTFELTEDKVYSKYFVWIDQGVVFNNIEIELQLEYGSTETSFEQHQEQSYIMPVQQEMLEGDYFDFDNEEEVHEWNKLILSGDEETLYSIEQGDYYLFQIRKNDTMRDIPFVCNKFINMSNWGVANSRESISNQYNSGTLMQFKVLSSRLSEISANGVKLWLKSQYDAGTPVIVYYKQQTPTRLPFTDEQKSVARELNNSRTYKNVTNITTDSKAIIDLDYVKDAEVEHNKMQNEIDEIKQLLSTTQTSALLLDNLQKEVESEVE